MLTTFGQINQLKSLDLVGDALERLLTDRELEARLRGGSLRTAAEFSWARLAGQHLDLYDRLLARSS
jgi:glycosyltransferase involved in cell wall biosynthesis